MNEIGFVGRALPPYILVPCILLFLFVMGVAIRRTPSRAGRFVLFAVSLRYVLSALHQITYGPTPVGLSLNALGSIAVFGLGLFMVRSRRVLDPALLPFYPLLLIMVASGLMNGQLSSLATVLTKYAYLIVLILATIDALEDLGVQRLFKRLLWCFSFPVTLQTFSIAMRWSKPGEADGAASYIGGYFHEAGFSLVLAAALLVTCFVVNMKLRLRLLMIGMVLIGIVFANYRTAILGVLPLVGAALFIAGPRRFVPEQRGIVLGAVLLLATATITIGGISERERFADVGMAFSQGTSLIKRPGTFSTEERRMMSGRPAIWSQYLYAWHDASPERQMIGFGPESWSKAFRLYAHNTLVSTVYEVGVMGVLATLLLWGWMLALALMARGSPILLLAAAHVGFFILNMATMPMWMIEGMIYYGLLCGYTVYAYKKREQRSVSPASLRGDLVARRALSR